MTYPFSKARRAVLQALTVSVTAAAGLCGPTAQAQDANTKPIRIIVPFAPGGSNDIVGREVAQRLGIRLKRSVIVENRPGAGGVIGADVVAHAEPDGTTLLLISSSFTMNNAIMKLNYDPVKSFTPVAMLGMGPSVVVVASNVPVNSIKEFVDYSKKNPGKVNFGSAGVGSFQHFAAELFRDASKANLTIVHYKGGAPALVDLAAGHVQMALGSLIQMQTFVKQGRIKILGVAGPKRVDLIPNVPTLKESGYDVDASNWWALLAPAGTPVAIVDNYRREVNAVLTDPEVKKRFANEGAESTPMSRAEFEKYMAAETAKWAKVAKQTGIKPE
jgi:tripartite-type tricarboxylate transporter receptor subunit TctC